MQHAWLVPLFAPREEAHRGSAVQPRPQRSTPRLAGAGGVLLCALAHCSACGGDDDAPAYEARIAAARERTAEATCACLWTDELRRQCTEQASAKLDACSAEAADALAAQQPGYADCLAGVSERQARCFEEAACRPKQTAACAFDAYDECGPVPQGLSSELAACLPHFRCGTGQEVLLTRRCDGTRDCFDGSDERHCDGNDDAR